MAIGFNTQAVQEHKIQDAFDRFKQTKDVREFQTNLSKLNLYPEDMIDGKNGNITSSINRFIRRPFLAEHFIDEREALPDSLPDHEIILIKAALNRLGYDAGPLNAEITQQMRDQMKLLDIENPAPLALRKLRQTIERTGPIIEEDGSIEIDPGYLNEKFLAHYDQLIADGKILPMSAEVKATLKQSVLSDFGNATITFPAFQESRALASTVLDQPHFIMMTPHEQTKGWSLDVRLKTHQKWWGVKNALEAAGAKITVIDGTAEAGGEKETWTRDRMLVIDNNVFMADMGVHKDKIDESDYTESIESQRQLRDIMTARGYNIINIKDSWFEGGNLVLHEKSGTIFMGMEEWSNEDSARKLIEAINTETGSAHKMQIVPLTENPPFYHLDLIMSQPLANGEVIFYPGGTDPDTAAKIIETIGKENIIEIDRETAAKFVTNLNYVGNTLVMTDTTPELEADLESRGYKIIKPEDYGLDSFEFGDGGVHCFTNEILPDDPATSLQTFKQ